MKFGYTIVYVSSVADALAFYEAAFGFSRRFLHESGSYGELDTGATTLAFAAHELGAAHFPAGYRKVDDGGTPLGIELGLVCADVPAAFDRAVAAGAEPLVAPAAMPWGQTVAWVRGKDGTLVELCTAIG
ncbi:VOC family protein [Derxia lacustris]|uniref:VOC family protein n=1 Tax=Derxia lacustris TaxID=764842 RepID=UPI000A177C99|nr:VOC family protein [Derxia lacustris]